MKKVLTLILALTLILCLASCDIEELLKDPEAADNQTSIDYGENMSQIALYEFEYRDNGDGTCAVTNIIINNSYKFLYGGNGVNVTINGSDAAVSANKGSGNVSSSAVTIVNGTVSSESVYYSAFLSELKIEIPEKNPDGLTVTSIEFGGFDSIVPKKIKEDQLYVISGKECDDEFSKEKFLSYYTFVDDGGYYELSEEFSNNDIYELGKMLIDEFKFGVSGYKTIADELGESVPNLALNVKTIVIPSTVKSISDYAFANCYNLETCGIPEGVEYNDTIFFATGLYEG